MVGFWLGRCSLPAPYKPAYYLIHPIKRSCNLESIILISSRSSEINPTLAPHTLLHLHASACEMATRPATKAGSWYVRDPQELEEQLDEYLGDVPANIDGSALPVPGARIIIAPCVHTLPKNE